MCASITEAAVSCAAGFSMWKSASCCSRTARCQCSALNNSQVAASTRRRLRQRQQIKHCSASDVGWDLGCSAPWSLVRNRYSHQRIVSMRGKRRIDSMCRPACPTYVLRTSCVRSAYVLRTSCVRPAYVLRTSPAATLQTSRPVIKTSMQHRDRAWPTGSGTCYLCFVAQLAINVRRKNR